MRVTSVVLFVAASCAGGKGGGGTTPTGEEGATFKVFYPDQPVDGFRAKVGKRFIVKPVATCTYESGRDARWSMMGAKIVEGELPDGFTIEEGTIAGTPKTPGTITVKVQFSGVVCAGKQQDDVVVPVIITAK